MPTDEEILSAFETTQKPPSDDDILAAFGTPVKKKESSVSAEPSTNDSKTPSPLLGKSGESKSFTERIAINELPQTIANSSKIIHFEFFSLINRCKKIRLPNSTALKV